MCHSAASTKVSALQGSVFWGDCHNSRIPGQRSGRARPEGPGRSPPAHHAVPPALTGAPPALCLRLQPLPRTTRVPVPTGCVEVGKVRGRSAGDSGDPKGPVAASSPRLGGGSAGGAGPGAGPTARSVPPHAPPRPDSESLGGRGRE